MNSRGKRVLNDEFITFNRISLEMHIKWIEIYRNIKTLTLIIKNYPIV